MAPKRKRYFFVIPFLILIVPLLGLIVMLLWNAILPELLGVKHINFWQSVGLLILCKILFGSFRSGGPGGFRGGPPWKHKLMNMTPEDRERFKQEWQQRWTDPEKDRC